MGAARKVSQHVLGLAAAQSILDVRGETITGCSQVPSGPKHEVHAHLDAKNVFADSHPYDLEKTLVAF